MEYRRLGNSGLKVSAYSFGTMTFGGGGRHSWMGDTAGEDARRQIDQCLEAGVNLFDTADIYSDGRSEEILGEALGERRKQVLVATKCFGRTGPGENDMGLSRHHIVEACEASLRRLKTDWIDLYQIHNQDRLTPVEETLRALDDLVSAGKVRYIGSSNQAPWLKMKALAASDRLGLARYVSQQIQYSLLTREAEDEMLPLGVDEGVGALIWSPLAMGYLSGKFRQPDAAGRMARRLPHIDTPHARGVLDAMDEVVAAHPGASLSQVALNWVVRKAGVSSVILGARTMEQLTDNLAAATWSLSDAEIARLDAASAKTSLYPYDMHRGYALERNPPLPLLPALPGA